MPTLDALAFAQLTDDELTLVQRLGVVSTFADGDLVFVAGTARIDLYIVLAGGIEIQNPADGDRVIVLHERGAFVGDIDLITGRPVLVTAIARTATTAIRIPSSKMRQLLNQVPTFGEKLIIGLTRRRELLSQSNAIGMAVVGPTNCKQTNLVREFFYKNFVPFTWHEPNSTVGASIAASVDGVGLSPIVRLNDGSQTMVQPTLRELAEASGVWQSVHDEHVQLAIVGAGPAGISAAVYAASEGLSTLLLDAMGPGGQASGSSKIENFIGFPAGLSGADLATRGVLQMLKFGARMAAPVQVVGLVPPTDPADPIALQLDSGNTIHADVVLLATGVRWRKLQALRAAELEGAGVHYICTAVEAILYDSQDVAVVGGGNSAGQAVMFLAECCRSRTVHMFVRGVFGKGMSAYLASRIRATPNVRVHEQSQITALSGDTRLNGITYVTEASDVAPASSADIRSGAVFAFIGADPEIEWLPTTMARDAHGFVQTGIDALRSGAWPLENRDPESLETSIPGVLAAGDVRSGPTKRVGFAVGDGSLAVTCTHKLIAIKGAIRVLRATELGAVSL
ncbi:MAG TPA: FAD-dependent oxidoreductase [Gemmatimonas sp.]|nr:FAD-dependent oxidoreductase [Gemmatimonas sp.]